MHTTLDFNYTDDIVESVVQIHKKHRKKKASVSHHTKSAQIITKSWQEQWKTNNKDRYKPEEAITDGKYEKIDLVDHDRSIAYELKVSGKNPHHEFYKDLVKVMTYNLYQTKKPLKTLVFITEKDGVQALEKRSDAKFMKMIKSKHRLDIKFASLEN